MGSLTLLLNPTEVERQTHCPQGDKHVVLNKKMQSIRKNLLCIPLGQSPTVLVPIVDGNTDSANPDVCWVHDASWGQIYRSQNRLETQLAV